MNKRDARLLEIFEQSTCFGIAHSDDVPECKQCDVKAQCKSKMLGDDIKTPRSNGSSPSVATLQGNLDTQVKENKEKAIRAKKATATPSVDPMKDIDALEDTPKPKKATTTTKAKTAKPNKTTPKPKQKPSSGLDNLPVFKEMEFNELVELADKRNVEWKDYGDKSITRMRLIMALKKSY